MKLMMEAADGGDAEAATKQLQLALLIDGALWMERVVITVFGDESS
jgi:hypothetical protein